MSRTSTENEYLRALRAELDCFVRGRELAAEVTGHLHESSARLVREGRDPEGALAEAIARLGAPREIAAAFVTQGEPLAVPTPFTRASGWLALLALPLWLATFGLMQGSQVAERTREWEGLPQTLFLLGMATMLFATLGFLATVSGLYRRAGGLGTSGQLAIGIMAVGVLLVALAWFVPAWTTALAVAFGLLGLRLRARKSPFSSYALVAMGGSLAALVSFFVVAPFDLNVLWGIPWAIMILPAVAIAMAGLRLAREPAIAVPAVIAS
jgi:hypothetical protein